jgi:hypothetical protein
MLDDLVYRRSKPSNCEAVHRASNLLLMSATPPWAIGAGMRTGVGAEGVPAASIVPKLIEGEAPGAGEIGSSRPSQGLKLQIMVLCRPAADAPRTTPPHAP